MVWLEKQAVSRLVYGMASSIYTSRRDLRPVPVLSLGYKEALIWDRKGDPGSGRT